MLPATFPEDFAAVIVPSEDSSRSKPGHDLQDVHRGRHVIVPSEDSSRSKLNLNALDLLQGAASSSPAEDRGFSNLLVLRLLDGRHQVIVPRRGSRLSQHGGMLVFMLYLILS